MGTWEKVIVSGSNAQLEALDIIQPSSEVFSLQVEDGQVSFPNLSISNDATFAEGTLTNQLGFVYAHNELTFEGQVLIPLNGPVGDINGDGTITAADLLIILGNFGSTDAGFGEISDMTQDGSVNVADILLFLSEFGVAYTFPDNLPSDNRPAIDWTSDQYTYTKEVNGESVTKGWVNPSGRVNVDSVTELYNHCVISGDDSAFWALLPAGNATSNNVSLYITQMPSENQPSLEIFLYIYFQQFTSFGIGNSDLVSGSELDVSPDGLTGDFATDTGFVSWKGGNNLWNRVLEGPNQEDGYSGTN